MTTPISFGKLDVSLTSDMAESIGQVTEETPFHMLILGDFSGRANCQTNNPGALLVPDYRPHLVDFETMDQLMTRLNVHLTLPALQEGGTKLSVTFHTMEDFHPDRLVRQGESLPALMSLHQRLRDPSTFQEASAEMQAWELAPSSAPSHQESKPAATTPSALSQPPPDPGGVLARILEETPSAPSAGTAFGDERNWQRFVEETVAPYLVPNTDPQQPERLSQVECAMGDLMRTLLHHHDFQHMEAAWQGLIRLTQRLELSTHLKLFVVDISKEELAADLAEGEDLGSSKLARLLSNQAGGTPGGQPWAVVAGNYTFDQTPEDISLLDRLAKLAKQTGAPFLAQASSQFIGCPSLVDIQDPEDWQKVSQSTAQETWQALRSRPEASYVGLALPRFLLRLPYGPNTEPIETWAFEELTSPPIHEEYLWGNPIFACLELIGRAFMEESWNGRPGLFLEVEGLPLHIFRYEGESRIKPCAEVLLSERAMECILDKGLMALFTLKDQDVIRLARLQSIAEPLKPLAGRWL